MAAELDLETSASFLRREIFVPEVEGAWSQGFAEELGPASEKVSWGEVVRDSMEDWRVTLEASDALDLRAAPPPGRMEFRWLYIRTIRISSMGA